MHCPLCSFSLPRRCTQRCNGCGQTVCNACALGSQLVSTERGQLRIHCPICQDMYTLRLQNLRYRELRVLVRQLTKFRGSLQRNLADTGTLHARGRVQVSAVLAPPAGVVRHRHMACGLLAIVLASTGALAARVMATRWTRA